MGSAKICQQDDRAAYAPAVGGFVITPSNVTVFDNVGANPPPARSIYVGGAGNLTCIMSDDSSVLFSAVPAGTILPITVKQVLSTGTTATLLIGLY